MAYSKRPPGLGRERSNGQCNKMGGSTVEVVPMLKACPFCGSTAVAVVGSYVRCGTCGATGPFGATAEDVAENWNERRQGPGDDTTSAIDEEHGSPG